MAVGSPRSATSPNPSPHRLAEAKTAPRKSPLEQGRPLRDATGRHPPTPAAQRQPPSQPPTGLKLSWQEASGPGDPAASPAATRRPPSPPRATSWEPLAPAGQPALRECTNLEDLAQLKYLRTHEEQAYLEKERQYLAEARQHEEETEKLVKQRLRYEQERLRLQQQLLEEERQRIEEQRRQLQQERQQLEEERVRMVGRGRGGPEAYGRGEPDGYDSAADEQLTREEAESRLWEHREARRREKEAARQREAEAATLREQEREERARMLLEQQRLMPRWSHQHPFALCPRRSGGAPPPRIHSQRSGSPDPVSVFVAGCQKGVFHKEVASPRTTTPSRSASLQRLCEGLPVAAGSRAGSRSETPRGSCAPSRIASYEPRPTSGAQSTQSLSRLSSYEPGQAGRGERVR